MFESTGFYIQKIEFTIAHTREHRRCV